MGSDSSDSEDDKRVVRSAKDRRYEELNATCAEIRVRPASCIPPQFIQRAANSSWGSAYGFILNVNCGSSSSFRWPSIVFPDSTHNCIPGSNLPGVVYSGVPETLPSARWSADRSADHGFCGAQNKMHINDWSAIQTLFDKLNKQLEKSLKVLHQPYILNSATIPDDKQCRLNRLESHTASVTD